MSGDPPTLTLSVDVAWSSKDPTGALLDPRNAASAQRIGDNIDVLFRVVGDDDWDGVEDQR